MDTLKTHPTKNTRQIGQQSEQKACDFLKKNGLTLLQQNFSCFCGEIDLIMQDNDTVVFVEVRSRDSQNYGDVLESITQSKQNKIARTAVYYLQKKKWFNKVDCRFDVIGISRLNTDASLEWIKDAFSTDLF